ncbi:MAG: Ig-like domain-containing protein, partial [Spongiibacter sp.]
MNKKQHIIRKLFISVTIVIAAQLTGCGGDQGDVTNQWSTPDTLIFSYPYPGQTEVPPTAPVVLRFSSVLDQTVMDDIEARLQLVSNMDDSTVIVDYQVVDNGRGLILRPQSRLLPTQTYQLVVIGDGLGAIDKDSLARVQFRT